MIDRETAARWAREAEASDPEGTDEVLAGRPSKPSLQALLIAHERRQRSLRRTALVAHSATVASVAVAFATGAQLVLLGAAAFLLVGVAAFIVASRSGRAFERRVEELGRPPARATA